MARTIRSCTLNSLLHNPDRPQGKPADQLMAGGSIPVSTSGSIPGSAKDRVDLGAISVAEENLFFNYDDSEPATVRFKISNGNELLLYFPEQGSCFLIVEANGKTNHSPSTFKAQFNCSIGFVPILGPLEHNELLFEKEAARLALFT